MNLNTTTLTGKIVEIEPIGTTGKDGEVGMPVKNLKVLTETVNRFGLKITEIAKIVLFNQVATLADSLFKVGDYAFMDSCRVQNRPYERNGETIQSQDVIANIITNISEDEFNTISIQLLGEAAGADSSDSLAI